MEISIFIYTYTFVYTDVNVNVYVCISRCPASHDTLCIIVRDNFQMEARTRGQKSAYCKCRIVKCVPLKQPSPRILGGRDTMPSKRNLKERVLMIHICVFLSWGRSTARSSTECCRAFAVIVDPLSTSHSGWFQAFGRFQRPGFEWTLLVPIKRKEKTKPKGEKRPRSSIP